MPTLPEIDIPIVFARSRSAFGDAQVGLPAILIVPDRNTWNDFGFRLYATMFVLLPQGEQIRHIRLMFGSQPNTAAYLDSLFNQSRSVVPIVDIPEQIVSLQRPSEVYGELVSWLGFERATTALRRLGDAVLLTLENDDPQRLALINSERFHVAIVRNPEDYRAFRRGGRFIRPAPVAAVQDAATSFTFYPRIPAKILLDAIDFDFSQDSLFDDRVAVLIGRNGVGKTQSLLALINYLQANEGTSRESTPQCSRVLMFSSVPSDPYPKSILPWHGIDYEYHAVAIDTTPLGPSFLLSLIDCFRDDGVGAQNGRLTRKRLLIETLSELGVWDELHVPLTTLSDDVEDQFPNVRDFNGISYFKLDGLGGEYRTISLANRIDWSMPAKVFDSSGEPRHLSSGELAMLQFAAQAIASIEQGSLLLLDEPETHLHPNYIAKFMDLLQELLRRTQSIAIVATHSAYIVREVPRQRVSIFIDSDEGTMISRPRIQSFGASVDSLSSFIFGDNLISHRFQRVLRRWAETQGRELGIEGVLRVHGERLNPETLSFIARVIDEANG